LEKEIADSNYNLVTNYAFLIDCHRQVETYASTTRYVDVICHSVVDI